MSESDMSAFEILKRLPDNATAEAGFAENRWAHGGRGFGLWLGQRPDATAAAVPMPRLLAGLLGRSRPTPCDARPELGTSCMGHHDLPHDDAPEGVVGIQLHRFLAIT